MDCCNYPEYRAQYCAGAGAGGSAGVGGTYSPYAPGPYSPYASPYFPPPAPAPAPVTEQYARLAAYGYRPPHHAACALTSEHLNPLEYGVYTGKEARSRRGHARRELLARTPIHSVPLPSTPPLECGVSGRGAYHEPQMWSQYQGIAMGVNNGWNGMSSFGGTWMSRGQSCAREYIRHPSEMPRHIKGSKLHNQNQVFSAEGRSTPFSAYEEPTLPTERARMLSENASTRTSTPSADFNITSRERYPEPRRPSPVEKKPPVVPLPAFQQAFGSTEIGRFAEAFSRAEVAMEDSATETFPFDSFSDWDGQTDPAWSAPPVSREIKCEESQ